MPNSAEVAAGDQVLNTQHNGTVADLPDWVNGAGVNLIKDTPSLELADGAAPLWWETNNCTLTEEDATGEALGFDPKHERILKGVTTAAGGYVQHSFDPDNESLLYAGESKVSTGFWVYTASTGTLKFSLRDSVDGEITSKEYYAPFPSSMFYVEVLNQTIGDNTLEWRLEHSANAATFIFSKPVLNLGKNVIPWRPRGLEYREAYAEVYDDDPGGITAFYIDMDLSSYIPANAVMALITVGYYNTTSVGKFIKVRRKGDTGNEFSKTILRNRDTNAYELFLSFPVMLDDAQTFQVLSTADAADTERLRILVRGYWQWEGS